MYYLDLVPVLAVAQRVADVVAAATAVDLGEVVRGRCGAAIQAVVEEGTAVGRRVGGLAIISTAGAGGCARRRRRGCEGGSSAHGAGDGRRARSDVGRCSRRDGGARGDGVRAGLVTTAVIAVGGGRDRASSRGGGGRSSRAGGDTRIGVSLITAVAVTAVITVIAIITVIAVVARVGRSRGGSRRDD